MNETKRKNPYQVLLDDIMKFCRKLRYRREKVMWLYPKGRLHEGWPLTDLYERIKAADQLGYDVTLKATDEGISVRYIERVDTPYQWRD